MLGVTALGADVAARGRARRTRAVEQIRWDGMHYRRDIGRRALERERMTTSDGTRSAS